MELIVKNEKEKALAERLQKNLATYKELTGEEKSFLLSHICYCQYLDSYGDWSPVVTVLVSRSERYRIDPSVNIVVEPETFAEREGIILCPIETHQYTTGWYINYPNGVNEGPETLGALRCKGYEFLGWVHNSKLDRWSDINCNPLVYISEGGAFWSNMAPNRKPLIATHSVWRKVEE